MLDETLGTWAIVELMGHRKLAGRISEATIAGCAMLRLDIPEAPPSDAPVTQFYSASSVYCITPCDEATARAVAAAYRPTPVNRFELPASTQPPYRDPDYPADDDPEEIEVEEEEEP